MILEQIVVGPLQVNCFVAACDRTKEGVVIDPGDDEKLILDHIQKHNLTIKKILLTHGHVDHISAVAEVQQATGATIHVHESEMLLIQNAPSQAAMFNLRIPTKFQPSEFFKDGEKFQIGELDFGVISTPGHSPGSLCVRLDDWLFSGDTLFRDSVGRTDIPLASAEALKRSLAVIRTLPESLEVFPGHGPSTTIGHELRYNPYL